MIWRSPISTGDLTETITGSGVVQDLATSSVGLVYVDHSDDAVFGLAEAPSVTVPDGVTVRVLEAAEVGGVMSYTDGSGFVLEITNDAYAGDLGYGGGGPDVAYTWTRRGCL